MYVLAVLSLLDLGTFAITRFGERFLAMIRDMWLLTAVGLGVAWHGWLTSTCGDSGTCRYGPAGSE